MIGQKLGHYSILERIGAGGMGEVYRAHHEHLKRDVAIKVLPGGMVTDERARKRFHKEAETLSKLSHPHIATVHDFDTQAGVDFLVMEYIAGETLAEKLAAGPLPEKEVVRLGMQLAEGLAAAHAEGIVHSDLKPGNLRLTPDGRLKILDFGLARLVMLETTAVTTDSVSQGKFGGGTLPYMAPEQVRGEPADARADLWAAGVVLYEMATGRRPFEARLATALAADIQNQPPLPPRQLNPRLSPRLEEIILKCLEKDAELRYQSARELLADFRRLAAPSSAVPGASPRAVRGWRQTLQRPSVLAAMSLVVLLAVLLLANVGGLRTRLQGPASVPQIRSLAVLPLENREKQIETGFSSQHISLFSVNMMSISGPHSTVITPVRVSMYMIV